MRIRICRIVSPPAYRLVPRSLLAPQPYRIVSLIKILPIPMNEDLRGASESITVVRCVCVSVFCIYIFFSLNVSNVSDVFNFCCPRLHPNNIIVQQPVLYKSKQHPKKFICGALTWILFWIFSFKLVYNFLFVSVF